MRKFHDGILDTTHTIRPSLIPEIKRYLHRYLPISAVNAIQTKIVCLLCHYYHRLSLHLLTVGNIFIS